MKDFGSVDRSVGYAADRLLEISRSSIKRNPYIKLLYSCSFLHLIISDQLYLSGKSPSRNDARAIRMGLVGLDATEHRCPSLLLVFSVARLSCCCVARWSCCCVA